MSQDNIKQIRIQSRVDTKANWERINPILLEREIGYEKETGKYKIGDGVNTWLQLSYSTVGNEGATIEQLNSKVDKIQGKQLSTNDFTNDYKNKVDNLTSIVGTKVDKVSGKGLSTNDFTNDYKSQVDNTENLINGKIAALVDSAPEALDTLGELSEAIKQHEDAYDALLEVVGNKADKNEIVNISYPIYCYHCPDVTLKDGETKNVYTIPNWNNLFDSNGNLEYYFITMYSGGGPEGSSIAYPVVIPLNTATRFRRYWISGLRGVDYYVSITNQGTVNYYLNNSYDDGDRSFDNCRFFAVKGQYFN